jgi:hypothetical protein
MQKKYVAPELKLAGDAEDVVLGGAGAGVDFSAEELFADMEFLADGEEE